VRALIKLAVVLAVMAALVFEVGSPVWARADAAGAAQDAANAAVRNYFDTNNLASARSAAVDAATVRGATLTDLAMLADGSIKVTVSHPSKYIPYHLSALKNWYNVSESATAAPIRA
jgi:Flp pilus assembly protein TadG